MNAVKRPLSPPDTNDYAAQHAWPESRQPLRRIDPNAHSEYWQGGQAFIPGAQKRLRNRFGLENGGRGYFTAPTPQPIFPPARRGRFQQAPMPSGNEQQSGFIFSTLPGNQNTGNFQSNPLIQVPLSGGSSNQAAAIPSTVVPVPLPAPSMSTASSNPVTRSLSPPIHPPKFKPSLTSSPISPSPVIYQELEEPRFALVTCKSFTVEERCVKLYINLLITLNFRLSLRVFLNIQESDKIAQDPTNSGLICVQKMFVDAAKAELFKLGFRKAYYDTEDGQSPQKVVVTLMSRPFIAVDKSVGGGAAPDGKRSVGRPPNKKN